MNEFIDEKVIDFTAKRAERQKPAVPDEQKYDRAVAHQQAGDDYDHSAYDEIVARDMEKMGGKFDDKEMKRMMKLAGLSNEVEEGSAENANALVGSGRADPSGKKTNPDSSAHRSVRTPDTTYSRTRKKYNSGAKPGANDGFVGG